MGKRKVHSETRSALLKMIAPRVEQLTKEIQKKVGSGQFLIRRDLVADEKAFKSIAHCKPGTRYAYISAVVSELQHKGLIKRNGKAFYFVRPAKGKTNASVEKD